MPATDVEILPLSPLGAEVRGLDLHNDIPQSVQEQLQAAFDKHALLLFRNQELEKADLLRTARVFGTISEQGDAPGGFNYISNVNKPGLNERMEFTLAGSGDGELLFHFDHCFQEHPLRAIMLYGLEIPPVGGDTRFSDVRLATARLPDKIRQRIDGHDIRHKSFYRDGRPEASHPIMYPHPRTGERVLFFSKLHAQEIIGLPADESAALLQQFPSYVEDEAIIYRHVWRRHDVVVWDNIALQHARDDFDPKYKRHMQRVQIA